MVRIHYEIKDQSIIKLRALLTKPDFHLYQSQDLVSSKS